MTVFREFCAKYMWIDDRQWQWHLYAISLWEVDRHCV